MKLIPSPPLKSVAALAAVAVFTCMLAASPVRAGAFEEYRAVDMKLQSVREGDAEGLRAAGVLVESFSKRWSKGAAERTMAAYLMLRWGIASGRHQAAYGAALVLLELKPSPEQRPGLLKLAAQLGYQSERFEAVPGHVDAWIEVKGMPRTATERAETAEMMTLAAYALHELGRDRQALALRHRTCPGARRLRARALRLARRREGRAGLPARDGARLERDALLEQMGLARAAGGRRTSGARHSLERPQGGTP